MGRRDGSQNYNIQYILNSKDEMQAGTYGQWGALLAGGNVIYPTGYGTLITAVILKSLCLIVVVVSVVADKEVI